MRGRENEQVDRGRKRVSAWAGDIIRIWPLHELKYGMRVRKKEKNKDILILYKGFPLSLRLSSSPFPISGLSQRDERARDEGARS